MESGLSTEGVGMAIEDERGGRAIKSVIPRQV